MPYPPLAVRRHYRFPDPTQISGPVTTATRLGIKLHVGCTGAYGIARRDQQEFFIPHGDSVPSCKILFSPLDVIVRIDTKHINALEK